MSYKQLIELAHAKVQQNQLDEAVGYYSRAIEINSSDAIVFNSRALIKNELGDFPGALEDLNQAIKINPYFAKAYYNRFMVKGNLNDYEGSVEDYKNFLGMLQE